MKVLRIFYLIKSLLVISKVLLFISAQIQENLEDEFVKEALNKGLDLRKYSKEIEKELTNMEKSSIKDCKNIFKFY